MSDKATVIIDLDELLDMEEQIIFQRLMIKKLKRKFPKSRLSKEEEDEIRMKARARVEYKYGLHNLNKQ